MSSEAQRVVVVVIEDASRDVSLSAIKLATQGLPLKPGDKLIFIRVLQQVTNPSTFSLKAGKFLGHKVKVGRNPDSMFGASQKMINEEVARKTEEFINNEHVKQILQLFDLEKIEHHVDVQAAASLKSVALEAAKNFRATWLILDRKMKKDKKFLMDRLTCGISRISSNNIIEELRGPKKPAKIRVSAGRKSTERRNRSIQVKYDEMIPGSSEEELSPRKCQNSKINSGNDGADHSMNMDKKSMVTKSSSSEHFVTTMGPASGNADASSSSYTGRKYSSMHETTERETTWEHSPNYTDIPETELEKSSYESPEISEMWHSNGDRIEISETSEVFRNSICSICRNRRPKIGWKRDFTYAELQAATEGFNPKNFLSEGGFGSVYRGEINRIKIAVKQHKNASSQGEKEFKSEVNVLSKARHENLVMLLGSCSEGNHRLLVYEYVCHGSLDQHLSKHSRRPLTWEKRMKIALGAAKGLEYLHGIRIIHRDMRPNNILVTHDYEALLGDFGLAKAQYEDKDTSSETRLVGTLGYLAPEYAEYGKVSTKTDVYSFGVVLLQLITGLMTTDKALGGRSLVGWARPLLKERKYDELIDERIVDTHDVHQLYWMVRVAEKCLAKDPKKRLSMDQVVGTLNNIIEGRTVCWLREFSPAKSDSLYSLADSGESRNDDRSITLEPTTMDSEGFESTKLPPSASLQVISSGGSSMTST